MLHLITCHGRIMPHLEDLLLLISILLNLNINKASGHNECIWSVHRNGSRIVMVITEFNYILTERDEIIVHWSLCMVFFALSNH